MGELLNSGMVGFGKQQTKEQIVTNWKATGLLEALNERLTIKTALTMEEVAQILLNTNQYFNIDGRIDVVAFPITRRIIVKLDEEKNEGLTELITGDYIMKKLGKLYPMTLQFFGKLYKDDRKFDVEAEASAFIADKIVEMFIKDNKDNNIINNNGEFVVVKKPLE